MSDPFVGEIRMFGFNFPPNNWAACNGALMNIQQNAALYSLLGTAFGGNGSSNFQLPNLAGRLLCGIGAGPGLVPRTIGDAFGEASVSLTTDEIPAHTHSLGIYSSGTKAAVPAANAALSTSDGNVMYITDVPTVPLSPTGRGGGNIPHENRQPLLAMNFSISLGGDYPQFA